MKKQGEKGDKLAQGGQVGGQIEQDELGEPEGEEGESRQDETGEFERRFARLERTIEDLAILSKSNQAAVTRIVKERSNLTVKKPKADPEPEAEEPEETPAKGYDDAGENYVEPEYPRGTSRDQAANPNTLRKIIIQFTPFSLMGYDYAVQNGFEGTESDFVNLTIESYFTSRGIELQWIKRTRIQAAPPQGRLTL